ncbi:MAG: hypothetical protein AAF809_02785 [Bacteroidota bacterium]
MPWTALSLLPTHTTPYVVSQRMKHAIESLDFDRQAAPAPQALIGIVSDAPTLQAFLVHCLERAFEVVVAPTVGVLAECLAERSLSLLVADLYTLDHQRPADLDLLGETYVGLPLLIVSQEPASELRKLSAPVLDRPHATLPLPTRPADLRGAATALLDVTTSPPSP